MDADSRDELIQALQDKQALIPAVANASVALRSPLALCLALQYFLWCVGVYGFVLWRPMIIQQGAARGIAVGGLFSSIPYLATVLLILLISSLSDRSGNRPKFIWPLPLFAGLALFGSYMTSSSSFSDLFLLSRSSRWFHVRPLWAILCTHCGAPARQRCRRGHRHGERLAALSVHSLEATRSGCSRLVRAIPALDSS